MKALRVRSHLALAVGLPALALAASLGAYLRWEAGREELTASIRRELGVLQELPRLRDRLAVLDHGADGYILTGDPAWLERRDGALRDLRRMQVRLAEGVFEPQDRAILARLDDELAAVLSEQEQWIERRRQGRLETAVAAGAAAKPSPLGETLEVLLRLKDRRLEALDGRQAALARAGRSGLFLLLAAGAAAAGLAFGLLWGFVVRPLGELERLAEDWSLGRPWKAAPLPASWEVARLRERMGEMAERLNRRFQKEEELVRLKTELVSMVTHEFNHALHVILGVSELLESREGRSTPEQRKEYYGILQSSVRSIGTAASSLLELARFEEGRFSLRPVALELDEALGSCARTLEPLSRQKRLSVTAACPPGLRAQADPDALALILTNLLSNAVKYTPEGGQAVLGAAAAEGGVEVYVKDSGIGIKPEDQERVFEGYYRTEGGQKAARGFGVGLALVKKLVEAHGSRLELSSEPGRGSRFSFVLPAAGRD